MLVSSHKQRQYTSLVVQLIKAINKDPAVTLSTCPKWSIKTIHYWLYVLVMSRTRFRVNPHSIVAWMSGNSLLEAGAKSEV